ncbi:MAG TPA: integrase core domain-containing protein [Candidatus Tectomicrobia bacterium]|nr:integrase core domain-containing protein [Candidatus Tectomicrobia bacterium]
MPWRHTSPMDQQTPCIADDLRRTRSITELCELDSVSRQTGDTWIERDLTSGPSGLEERARTPCSSPHQTPQHLVDAFIELRGRHPSWGAKKLLSILQKRHPSWALPGRSTVCDILRRHGLVPKTRPQRHIGHPGKPTTLIAAPNDVWSAEFKGQFKTGDGLYCYPLTVADGYRRFLLGCQALSSTRVAEAKPVFTRLLKACGLPKRLRTDHGVPFATHTLGRLSHLSAWWGRLGILPECIEPGTPQQNGRHERMHRTVKADTTRPPARTRRAQQRKFDPFRAEFHGQRPHEALDMRTPAACYEPSPRKMPNKPPPLAYPDRFEVRDVRANGGIRWHHPWGNVSHVCVGEYVGLDDIDDGVWNVYFGPLTRGRWLARHRRIDDAYGRLKRCR